MKIKSHDNNNNMILKSPLDNKSNESHDIILDSNLTRMLWDPAGKTTLTFKNSVKI